MHPVKIEGKEVIDATKRIVIEINRQDISSGRTKAPDACAAAKACMRQIPKCTQARVFLSRTYLKIGNKWVRFHTPQAMRLEIAAFDRGTNFFPGVYVLNPMKPSAKVTGKTQGAAKPKGVKRTTGSKGKRGPYHRLDGVREFHLD